LFLGFTPPPEIPGSIHFIRTRETFGSVYLAPTIAVFTISCRVLNSARLSPAPLVFKTVREIFTSHGSSVIRCLLRIPHYPFVLDFFKSSDGLRLGTVAARLVARTAIFNSLCVVAMSVKELTILIRILSTLRFGDFVVNFYHIIFSEKQIAVGTPPFLLFQEFGHLTWHFWIMSGEVRGSPLSPPLRTQHESFQLTALKPYFKRVTWVLCTCLWHGLCKC